MNRLISLCLLLFLLSACAAPGEERAPGPETTEVPSVSREEDSDGIDETGDHVLLTLEAPLAGGQVLTLEAVGKTGGESLPGVREVKVYNGETLLQTVSVREATNIVWDFGDGTLSSSVYDYTECPNPEKCMEVLDLNFDGNADFGLFGWPANNTIPYYYWLWDAEKEQYRYAFTLQGVTAHPEEGEISSEYKSGSAGSQWIVEYYRPGEDGELYLDRVERDTCEYEPESGFLDYDRGWAHEVWIPPETRWIKPGGSGADWSIEDDLVLVRREVPLYELNADNTFSHYTEIWEFPDGKPQLVEREEYIYEDQQ